MAGRLTPARLRAARLALGMSQPAFGAALGMTGKPAHVGQTVSHMESGRRWPPERVEWMESHLLRLADEAGLGAEVRKAMEATDTEEHQP